MHYIIKCLWTIFAIFLIAGPTHAQMASSPITVDFLSLPATPSATRVQYGRKYQFVITNINKSLYKIEDTVTQQDYNTTKPKIFEAVKLPAYLNLGLPTGPGDNPALAASPTPASPSPKDVIDNRLATIANALVVFNEAAVLDNAITNGLNSCNTAYTTIQADVVSAADAFLHLAVTPRTAQSAAIFNRIRTAYSDAAIAGHALEGLLPDYLNTIDLAIESNKDVITEWDKHPLPASDPAYDSRFLAYLAAKAENIAYTNYKETIKAQVAKAQAVVAEMKKFNDDNKTQALVDKYNQVNVSNFTFISDEVKVKSDEVKFDIKISALKQLSCDIPSKFSISETYKTRGGWKVDFSTGIFVNSGSHDFLGQEFQYVPNPADDTKVVIKEKDGGQRVLLSVGALAHFYRRTGRFANVAISPGLSTTTALDGLNFHLGGSLLLGTKNRVVLTGG